MRYLTGDVGKTITLQNVIDIVESGETELMLTTNGGNFHEALAIRDYLKATNKIKSIGCLGVVASAGTIIMQGVQDRWATPSSQFLIHNVQGRAEGDAADLMNVATRLQEATNKLINDYSLISGKDNEFITALMNEERPLDADEAQSLNLINRISNLENFMSKKEEDVKFLSNFANKLKSFLFTNLVIQSTDGTELDLGESIESIEQIEVGTPCSQNGTYVLTDGRTIVVEGNKVTEVTEAEPQADPMVEQLKAENEALKAELEATNKKVVELTNKAEQFTALNEEFNTFKNQFSNEKIDGADVPKDEPKEVSRIKITRK